MAEPMVSHDAIGFYLLSQEVCASTSRWSRAGRAPTRSSAAITGIRRMMREPRRRSSDYARVFFDRDQAEMAQAARPAHGGRATTAATSCATTSPSPAPTAPIDQALRLDTTVMLVDDPVKRVDNMTMAWGLEARVPFLDHELVELAARMPAELKIAEGGKYVLKEAARRVVPGEVIDRPKGYFPVPALKYLRGALPGPCPRRARTAEGARARPFPAALRRSSAGRAGKPHHAPARLEALAGGTVGILAPDTRHLIMVQQPLTPPLAAPA